MTRLTRFISSALLLVLMTVPVQSSPVFANEKASGPEWSSWDAQLFKKAKEENRFVILDLKAVWCHWCHVMEETTYQDPKVLELLRSRYIPVSVDQDSNPELSSRYEDYGWPATIIFGPDGQELVKRRGYIPPEVMESLLLAVIADPTPGPSVTAEQAVVPSENAFLTPEQKQTIFDEHFSLYDKENGGWGNVHKLIDADHLEWSLLKAMEGDKQEAEMARKTLDAALNLLDPVWGGFYQYSDQADWKSPHYEKIMAIQAIYIRSYVLGYQVFKEPKYLEAAKAAARYLKDFWLDKDGGFYTSQDADVSPLITGGAYYPLKDEDRRAMGMPVIDKHIYSRENGWAIQALLSLYGATAEHEYLQQARRAAEWIVQNRALPEGGFSHDEKDAAGPYLGDSLQMARAFLGLYTATADKAWLDKAKKTADFVSANFLDDENAGFAASVIPDDPDVHQKVVKQLDENTALARFYNLLFYYTGNKTYKEMAGQAMRYLASPVLLNNRKFIAGILLADAEIASEPDHITIVGHKDDPAAKNLFLEALAYPSVYKRAEWWDKREGNLPNPDVEYPELPKAAAFACANHICSLPVFTPDKLSRQVDRLKNKNKTAS